jgi:hypothetical protein
MKLKVMYQSICLLLKRNLFIDPARAEVKLGEDADRGLDRGSFSRFGLGVAAGHCLGRGLGVDSPDYKNNACPARWSLSRPGAGS